MTGHEHHPDPISEEEASALLAPLGSAAPSPQARQRAAAALSARVAAAPRGFALRHRLLIGASALVAPLMAVTAVGALTGGSLGAPFDLVSSAASSVTGGDTHSTVSASDDEDSQGEDVNDDENDDPGDDEDVNDGQGEDAGDDEQGDDNAQDAGNDDGDDDQGDDQGDDAGAAGTPESHGHGHVNDTTPAADETPTPGDAPTETTDPHANGHGCDDVIFAGGTKTTGPGGPVGCDVGNSGDHRKNGGNGETPTPTPAAGETPAPGDTPTEGADPHANGHGCDDVKYGEDGTKTTGPGGPVGCGVGNSGDHRKNGANGEDGTPTPTGTSSTEGHGNSANAPGHTGEHGNSGSSGDSDDGEDEGD